MLRPAGCARDNGLAAAVGWPPNGLFEASQNGYNRCMPIRTTQFFEGFTTIGGPVALVTVPAGQTWLLKDAILINEGGVNDTGSLGVLAWSGNVYHLIMNQVMNAHTLQRNQGFTVLKPGDALFGTSVGGNLQVLFSGAKLAGIA
jgi:hypothetical protein